MKKVTFHFTAEKTLVSGLIRFRTAGLSGNQGDICWDSDYIYVCISTNTWKRANISTW